MKPAYLPDLSAARFIGVDCETFDPELTEKGPGWARGVGHIVGVSISADGGGKWYFPMRHEIEQHDNWDPEVVLAWLRVELGRPHQAKVGANITYDVGWLKHEGVEVKGLLYDVQFAEGLLDERARVSLETLGQKYLGQGKSSEQMYSWLARAYGGKADSKQRANIYRCPPKLVGYYAEDDADLPLRLLPIMWGHLQREGLADLFSMECRLIPLLVAMRFAGVRVNIPYAEQLRDKLLARQRDAELALDSIAGESGVDAHSTEHLVRVLNRLGIKYGKTKGGAPSITANYLELLDHPIGMAVRNVRKLQKLRTVFIESYILNAHVNGRVFCQFHPLRGDDGGTRSGRFSSSDPNLQNIPSRDEILAPMIREMFIPDEFHKQWRRYDYSQIEYRFLIHFACGKGSDEVRAHFNAHPETDYHEMVLDMVAPYAGWDISTKEQRKVRRKPLKNINFGLIYGMGKPKLVASLGLDKKEGNKLFDVYHTAVPFAKPTMEECGAIANTQGEIRTILNRRSQFNLWEPAGFGHEDAGFALPYELAIQKWASIQRAGTHKALNRRLQGSAADMIKKAMLQCWEEGVFDERYGTGVPRLTVHDELDFSDPGGREEAFRYMRHVLETAIPLRIPVRADEEMGPDWGHCK